MRKLKLEMQGSVDGFTADVNGSVDWMVWNWTDPWTWDEPLRRHHNSLVDSSDCILLSRKMADEGFLDHWAAVTNDPTKPQFAFAASIMKMRKIVFSNTLEKPTWKGVELVTGRMVNAVTQLKAEEGADILVFVGPTFASSLVDADLIDEFHLFVNPAILGSGRSMFQDARKKSALRLASAKTYECGVAVLIYTR